ncbi:MAG: antirestriction protein [Acidimicrobiales bacterium mtb01]|nr:MAG: antirestriction protein [Acidimicrobiales bacterium mtb01]
MKVEELFEKVTVDLITAIKDGAKDWRMPWHGLGGAGLPRSADGRPYRGWNSLVLAMVAADRSWKSSTWATYHAWKRHGAQVRRGERGIQVVLWKPTERHETSEDGGNSLRRSLFARAFTVFAAEQVDGAEGFTTPWAAEDDARRIEAAEAYFAAVGADVVHGGDQACYVPRLDRIHLPHRHQFEQISDYYSTAAHEHTHWTGHTGRLGRDLSGRFGDHAYGAEELVAELGAAFWCAQFELDQATREDHAAYLGDWLALLQSDSRALVAACGHAQRAVDHLNTLAGWSPPGGSIDEPLEVAA